MTKRRRDEVACSNELLDARLRAVEYFARMMASRVPRPRDLPPAQSGPGPLGYMNGRWFRRDGTGYGGPPQ